MIELKLVIPVILWAQLVNGNQYGARMRTEALARSNIDSRIVAILNTGQEVEKYFDKYDKGNSKEIRSVPTGIEIKPQKLLKKFGSDSFSDKFDLKEYDSPENDDKKTPIIEVNASDVPISIIFKTNSPKVNVEQQHKSEPAPEPESTRTEDEPHRIIHEVYRPVIQELKEVIQPFRKVTQQIDPVIEEVHQVVHSSKPNPAQMDTRYSIDKTSKFKMGTTDGNSLFASYQTSKPEPQKVSNIPQKLLVSESQQKTRISVTTDKNMQNRPTIRGPAFFQPTMNESDLKYFSLIKEMSQIINNKNSLRNRYLAMTTPLETRRFQDNIF